MYYGDDMRTMIFGAGSDLGVHIDGASLGPIQLMNDLASFYQGESMMRKNNARKLNIVKYENLLPKKCLLTYLLSLKIICMI